MLGLTDSLVVLTLVLGDVELCVQLIQQRVCTLLTQRVIDIALTRHDVKQIARYLQDRGTPSAHAALNT